MFEIICPKCKGNFELSTSVIISNPYKLGKNEVSIFCPFCSYEENLEETVFSEDSSDLNLQPVTYNNP